MQEIVVKSVYSTTENEELFILKTINFLIWFLKCLNGTRPTYIGSLFKIINIGLHTPYGLRGKGLNLELPNFHLTFKKNSFTYSLTKLWNSLPPQLRLSSDAIDFKRKLHDYSFLERVL